MLLYPFLRISIIKLSALEAFFTMQLTWSAQLKPLRKIIPKIYNCSLSELLCPVATNSVVP